MPLLIEFAENDMQRNVFRFVADTGLAAFTLATAPETPEDRLTALEKAFAATLNDPAFREEAKKLGFPIQPLSRKTVTEAVERMTSASQETLQTVRKAMGYE